MPKHDKVFPLLRTWRTNTPQKLKSGPFAPCSKIQRIWVTQAEHFGGICAGRWEGSSAISTGVWGWCEQSKKPPGFVQLLHGQGIPNMVQGLIPRLDFPRGVLEWFQTQFQTHWGNRQHQQLPTPFHEKTPGVLQVNALVQSRDSP